MQHNKTTILAINPGTRYTGIAVLKGTVLLDWSVKVVSGKLSPSKLQRMTSLIDHLVSFYEPDIIVRKQLHPSRSSKVLNRFCRDVESIANSNGIKLSRYSIDEVEHFFASGEKINKIGLAELLCQKHPALRRELERERDSFNPYHIRMFEAVALANIEEAITRSSYANITTMSCDEKSISESISEHACIFNNAGV